MATLTPPAPRGLAAGAGSFLCGLWQRSKGKGRQVRCSGPLLPVRAGSPSLKCPTPLLSIWLLSLLSEARRGRSRC